MRSVCWSVGLLLCCGLGLVSHAQDAPANLLRNADFAEPTAAGAPAHWRVGGAVAQDVKVAPDQGPTGKPALVVRILNVHSHYGEVEQKVKVSPNTGYTLAAWLRSSAKGLAFMQVKLYRDRREIQRITGTKSGTEWQRVVRDFHSGDADQVGVICRYLQNKGAVGQSVAFADLSLTAAPPPVLARPCEAVATFGAIGVRVPCRGAVGPRLRCPVRYREAGATAWRAGLPLFFCPTDSEFRGSIVGLRPGTTYEVECWLAPVGDGEPVRQRARATTWSEEIPVREVRTLPERQDASLVIREGGDAEGWIAYRPAPGAETLLEVTDESPYALVVESTGFVLIEGLSIRGGLKDGVVVRDSHHVVLRGCDIAGWGEAGTRRDDLRQGLYVDSKGKPINYQAGVRLMSGSHHVVVEHNFIHDPRGTANSWAYGHPLGPQGLILDRTGGNNVVRWNDIVGSETHWWNDAIESIRNGDVTGGPHKDTDIYGNVLLFCNDDGTELDGGQINVRYHHNWICWALCGISCAPNCSGPSYVYRNLIAGLGEERFAAGSAFKMGGNQLSPGMNVILHNTIHGSGGGLRSVGFGKGKDRGAYVAFSRNNVFATSGRSDVTNVSKSPRNDFDFDLTGAGGVTLACGGEEHGIAAAPEFVNAAAGDFRLGQQSAGVDQACRLNGFNDVFSGTAPDMGAFESGEAGIAAFPPRPGGMSALPLHAELRHAIGKRSRQEIALLVPAAAGRRWTAVPNASWLRCEPSAGVAGDGVQTVLVGPDPGLSELRLHRGAITFRTDRGFCRTVLLDVKVHPTRECTVVLEAEAGNPSGGFRAVENDTASGGAYIHALEATAPSGGAGHEESQAGKAVFVFDVTQEGVYHVLGRCMVLGPKEFAVRHDSFYMAFDEGERLRWDVTGVEYDRWQWVQAREQAKRHAAIAVPLTAGRHTLTVYSREPLTRLDRIAVTNSPYAEPPREP